MTVTLKVGRHTGELKDGEGDPCDCCGMSDMRCMKRIRAGRRACCNVCYSTDTHGIDKINAEIEKAKKALA